MFGAKDSMPAPAARLRVAHLPKQGGVKKTGGRLRVGADAVWTVWTDCMDCMGDMEEHKGTHRATPSSGQSVGRRDAGPAWLGRRGEDIPVCTKCTRARGGSQGKMGKCRQCVSVLVHTNLVLQLLLLLLLHLPHHPVSHCILYRWASISRARPRDPIGCPRCRLHLERLTLFPNFPNLPPASSLRAPAQVRG